MLTSRDPLIQRTEPEKDAEKYFSRWHSCCGDFRSTICYIHIIDGTVYSISKKGSAAIDVLLKELSVGSLMQRLTAAFDYLLRNKDIKFE